MTKAACLVVFACVFRCDRWGWLLPMPILPPAGLGQRQEIRAGRMGWTWSGRT